ncbi:hypothetical protein C8F04DRAFT_1176383 [Mycena alexandri]|uniref:Uncharacterized protein n=1 Tax=Mycena alexandri TaxID=1745969 RepID=A0AAD6T9G1_9AGAR|nr:hypothetical protein C8F04DRAFT_1176383 [Mycena alexandri]
MTGTAVSGQVRPLSRAERRLKRSKHRAAQRRYHEKNKEALRAKARTQMQAYSYSVYQLHKSAHIWRQPPGAHSKVTRVESRGKGAATRDGRQLPGANEDADDNYQPPAESPQPPERELATSVDRPHPPESPHPPEVSISLLRGEAQVALSKEPQSLVGETKSTEPQVTSNVLRNVSGYLVKGLNEGDSNPRMQNGMDYIINQEGSAVTK